MTTTPRHSVSVAGVVTDHAGRVLVIQRRDNGRWEVPGGVLELGESVTDGLKREVFEETGYAVEPVALSGVYKNMVRGVVALVFRARLVGGVRRVTAEAERVEWLAPDEVRLRVVEAQAVRISDALSAVDQVPVRSHDGHRLLGPA